MKNKILIDGTWIGEGFPTYLIAEMSANHLQNLERAKKIIEAAKNSGANAIKLQTYKPGSITIECKKNDFLASKGSHWEGKYLYDLYKEAYLPWEWHGELFAYAKELNITIFSTPFDIEAVEMLEGLDAPAYKIASYEIMDIPLIKKVAQTGKPIILSTGIANLSDIDLALKTCIENNNDNVIILKCVSSYPTEFNEINLNTIPNMKETFDCIVGLSDHSLGNSVAIAATALGTKVIEKHMTISRDDGGPDGFFSLEPYEFKEMAENVRNIEQAMGKVTYELSDKQKRYRKNARSLYVVKDIAAGELLTASNIKSIRPGLGLPPLYYEKVIGRKTKLKLERGTALLMEHIDFGSNNDDLL